MDRSISLRRSRAFSFIACVLTLSACDARPFQAPNPMPEGEGADFKEVNATRALDILFMIDNSHSMADEQKNLRRNFRTLIQKLQSFGDGFPDIHIGIISSDVGAGTTSGPSGCSTAGGDRGEFRPKPRCGLREGEAFIKSYGRGAQNNFDGALEDVFECLADLGTGGCGFEHQLQAVRVALAGNRSPNAGFLRDDAYLAIIMITDEDDCSAEQTTDLFVDPVFTSQSSLPQSGSLRCNLEGHLCNGMRPQPGLFSTPLADCRPAPKGSTGRLIAVEDIVADIKRLKTDGDKRIIVSAITGKSAAGAGAAYQFRKTIQRGEEVLAVAPVCSLGDGADDGAAPPLRLQSFVESFGTNGLIESICATDYSPALETIAKKIVEVASATCLSKPMDLQGEEPGVQPECTVSTRIPKGDGGAYDDVEMPECVAGGPRPCWKLLQAAGAPTCKGEPAIDFEEGDTTPARGSLRAIKCRSCAKADDPRCAR